MNEEQKKLSLALSAPFGAEFVRFKPQAVSGNRAMAVAYVDSRAVMMRLDSVFGPLGWSDSYRVLDSGSVVCTLRVRFGEGEWVEKSDVGSPSDQNDEGDRLKSAFSDSLKRAAVHLGISRYLYRLPTLWCDWDAQKKTFVRPPTLPSWALPTPTASKQSA